VLACLAIAVVGWILSDTFVRRLLYLRRVTVAVEEGDVTSRVPIAGTDEIAGVSTSVNGMLDTIVGLLDVAQRQRDALISAAERLFSDVRVAGSGDLSVNARVSADPVGMLGNAFNLTVGRFRRFVLRSQATVDQLDLAAHQLNERARLYLASATQLVAGAPVAAGRPESQGGDALGRQLDEVRNLAARAVRAGASSRAPLVLDLAERVYYSAGRLTQLATAAFDRLPPYADPALVQAQVEELRTLGGILERLAAEVQSGRQRDEGHWRDLDQALGQLDATARSTPLAMAAAGDVTSDAASRVAELNRLMYAFSRDVGAMARQLARVTQDLRDGLMPFRLEDGAPAAPPSGPSRGQAWPHR
jgi:HAMP domain-containing protein